MLSSFTSSLKGDIFSIKILFWLISEIIEGIWNYERTVVVRFPDYETAINWYNSNEYSPIKEIRKINSEGNAIIVDGI